MSEERNMFFEEVNERTVTARSARNRKNRDVKGGRVILPSDHYTKKQLESMNGEVKTYRLGEPMTWDEFCVMPDDLKYMYINDLRKKFGVPDEALADAFGVRHDKFSKRISNLGMKKWKATLDGYNWYETADHEKFNAWWVITEEE